MELQKNSKKQISMLLSLFLGCAALPLHASDVASVGSDSSSSDQEENVLPVVAVDGDNNQEENALEIANLEDGNAQGEEHPDVPAERNDNIDDREGNSDVPHRHRRQMRHDNQARENYNERNYNARNRGRDRRQYRPYRRNRQNNNRYGYYAYAYAWRRPLHIHCGRIVMYLGNNINNGDGRLRAYTNTGEADINTGQVYNNEGGEPDINTGQVYNNEGGEPDINAGQVYNNEGTTNFKKNVNEGRMAVGLDYSDYSD